MGFFDDALVQDANFFDHQQAHIPHDIRRKFGIADFVTLNIEAELLPLDATFVGKIDFKVEYDALLSHHRSSYLIGEHHSKTGYASCKMMVTDGTYRKN